MVKKYVDVRINFEFYFQFIEEVKEVLLEEECWKKIIGVGKEILKFFLLNFIKFLKQYKDVFFFFIEKIFGIGFYIVF